jgi:hypothetical protein
MNKYLEDHNADAKNVERTNIMMNDAQPNPFTVLLILINLISRMEDNMKASIMTPLLPGSESPPSKFGFTSAEVTAFENAIMGIMKEAEGLMEEYNSVVEGKLVTHKFSSITFLNSVEVQKALNADTSTELPRFDANLLPDTIWLSAWAKMVATEAKSILKNVDSAVADISSVPHATGGPDETKVEEPLFPVSEADVDSFEDVPAAAPTHITKRDIFDDMDFPAPVVAPIVHKEEHMESPMATRVVMKLNPSHNSHPPAKHITYVAVPTDVAEYFSEFDESDVEGPAPTGSF